MAKAHNFIMTLVNRKSSLVLLLISLLLAACNDASETTNDAAWIVYESVPLAISFDQPATWVAAEASDNITFANDLTVLNASHIDNGAGGYISVEPIAAYGNVEDPTALLSLLAGDFTSRNALTIREPVTARDIRGQNGATVVLEGTMDGQAGIFVVTVIINEGRLALLLGIDASPDGEHLETMARISQSIELK